MRLSSNKDPDLFSVWALHLKNKKLKWVMVSEAVPRHEAVLMVRDEWKSGSRCRLIQKRASVKAA